MRRKVRSVFSFIMQGFAHMFYAPRTEFREAPKFPKTAKEAFEQDMKNLEKDAKKVWGEDWKWPTKH